MDIKVKEQLVNDIITKFKSKAGDNIDFSDGEPLKTLIEAIAQEMDIQYWQLENIEKSSYIDSAENDDLTELVKIIGVERKGAIKSVGEVTFLRETPALQDYVIPTGTIVSTYPDNDNFSIQFKTTEQKSILTGGTSVNIAIESVEGGSDKNIVSSKVVYIVNPPNGIESVINSNPISGGEDEETDEELRERAKLSLDGKGLGTAPSLKSNIEAITGVASASVVDMARGLGTVDILILGDIVPLSQPIKDLIDAEIERTKAGGIDVTYYEPTVNSIAVTATLVFDSSIAIDKQKIKDNVIIRVNEYIKDLNIGETLFVNQLIKVILETDESIIDVTGLTPSSNTVVNSTTIIRPSTVTING